MLRLTRFREYDFQSRLATFLLFGFAFTLPITIAGTVLFESLLLALWLFGGRWREKYTALKNSPLSLAVIAFIAYNLVVLAWTSDIRYGLDYIGKYRHFLLIPVIVYYLRCDRLEIVVNAFLYAMGLAALMSAAIQIDILSIPNVHHSDPSPFVNHVDFSNFLAFAALISFTRHLTGKNSLIFSPNLVLFLLFAISLFMNAGRTGQISFLIALFAIIVLHSRHRLRALAVSAALTGIVVFTIYQVSPVFQSRLSHTLTDIQNIASNDLTGSIGIRLALWKIGLSLASKSPILGYGIGDETIAMQEHIVETRTNPLYLSFSDNHNAFLTLWLQGGILNLLFGVYFFLHIARLRLHERRTDYYRTAFLIIGFINAMAGNAFHLFLAMTFYSLFAGIFERISKQPKLKDPHPETG